MVFLLAGAAAAVVVIGFGLYRLLSDRAEVAEDLLRQRSFAAAWAARALADELERCQRALLDEGQRPRSAGCAGLAARDAPFRWFTAADPLRAGGPLPDAAAERRLRRAFSRGCAPEAAQPAACAALAERMAGAERWADPLLARYGLPVLRAVQRRSADATAARRLRRRLERILFEDALRRHHEQLLPLLRPAGDRPGAAPRWMQLGRYRLTDRPDGGGVIGFDSQAPPGAVQSFLLSRNVFAGGERDLFVDIQPQPGRRDVRTASTAFIDQRVGFLVVEDPHFEARLAEARRSTELLLGWFSLAGVLLLASLLLAWRAARRTLDNVRQRENFTASVSHEFRSPLGSLALMIETLLADKIDSAERRREYLQQMQRETQRLNRLAENLLALGRMRRSGPAAGASWRPAPVLAAALEQARAEAEAQDVAIEAAPAADLPQGAGDGELVQMALLNLIDNAIKFSPPASRVQVAAAVDDGALRFSVADRGPGIPPRERERIFDWFYRPGDELNRQTRGTGLGLAIVREVAQRHGGRVEVRERPGGGSRFDLWLPCADSAGEDATHGG